MAPTYTPDAIQAQRRYLLSRHPDIVTADEFADALGVKEGSEQLNELSKLNLIREYVGRNSQEPPEKQDPPLSEFCAAYLPKLVQMFIDPPPVKVPGMDADRRQDMRLHNAYLDMLVAVQHVPYFIHYFRSDKPTAEPGKRLPIVLADRIVSVAQPWHEWILHPTDDFSRPQYQETLADAIQLLGTLVTIFRKKDLLPDGTKDALLPWLKKWANMFNGNLLGTVSSRLVQIFKDPEFRLEMKGMRSMLKNWNTCEYPGCHKKEDLKTCSRCRTVVYCSPEHQKEHWKYSGKRGLPHKALCFKTAY
ncbi:hypothetical protein CYLTODRAFT_486138 [Cylindrobasidium torrendii FP15055 ss-10]|uniref:MYND-type domain-containing protein n=1 Tax=Cylindrobasidium torrendii FP15055 ss-10 TaxID=1314674 RepID=A0A0D7BR41_9AGAR|nr:hypothetical protein CYLTODRAFT_486138 [Cylindrobasidium torrendii FP15055 ss-10]